MKVLKVLLFSVILCTLLPSCVDSDYHWDNINTEGVLNIPPVPLGSFDKMFFEDMDMDIITIPGEIPSFEFEYRDTLKNVFGTNVVKDFFHPYMTNDLSLEGDLNVQIFGEKSNWKVNLEFHLLDNNYKILDDIVLKGIGDIKNGDQKISIVFPKEYGGKMENVEHLMIKIIFITPSTIELDTKDHIELSNMIIKTGGYFVDL